MTTLILFLVCEVLSIIIAGAVGAVLMHRSIYHRYVTAQQGATAALEARDQAIELARSQARLELESHASDLTRLAEQVQADSKQVKKDRVELEEIIKERVAKETKAVKTAAEKETADAKDKVEYAEKIVAGKLDGLNCQCGHAKSLHILDRSPEDLIRIHKRRCAHVKDGYYGTTKCSCETFAPAPLTRKQAKEYLK